MVKTFEVAPSDSLKGALYMLWLFARYRGAGIYLVLIAVPLLLVGNTKIRLIIIFLICLILYSIVHSVYITNRKKEVYGLWTLTVTEDGIRFVPPNHNQVYLKWSNTEGIRLTRSFLYVMTAGYNGVMVPRGTFTAEEEAQIVQSAGKVPIPGAQGRWKRFFKMLPVYILALLLVVGLINHFMQQH